MNQFLELSTYTQYALVLGFFVSFTVSLLIVTTKKYHGKFSLDYDIGIQKIHKKSAPRIGGIALLMGILVILPILITNNIKIFSIIIICSLPMFFVALLEDITGKIRVRIRLLVTALSALFYVYLSGFLITDVDIEFLNLYLSIPIISIAFTVFFICGVTNSINLIDGYHGLASGTSIFLLIAIAIIANYYGDIEIYNLSIILSSIILGFFIVNYPFGKLFLGDAGAYLLGFIISIFALILPIRNEEISPWVSFAILAYPVIETVFSIIRRFLSKGQYISKPDKNHMHHLVNRIIIKIFNYFRISRAQNAMTSSIMLFFPMSTILWAIYSDFKSSSAIIYIFCFFIFYIIIYFIINGFRFRP